MPDENHTKAAFWVWLILFPWTGEVTIEFHLQGMANEAAVAIGPYSIPYLSAREVPKKYRLRTMAMQAVAAMWCPGSIGYHHSRVFVRGGHLFVHSFQAYPC